MGCGGVTLIRSEIVVGVGATVRRTWVASESVPVLTDQRSTPQRAKRDGGTAVTTATAIAMGRNLLWNSRILASLDSVRNEGLCYWPVALQAISKFCFSFRKTAREPPAIVACGSARGSSLSGFCTWAFGKARRPRPRQLAPPS